MWLLRVIPFRFRVCAIGGLFYAAVDFFSGVLRVLRSNSIRITF